MTRILDHEVMSKVIVYWPPGAVNEDGERSYGTPVEIVGYWDGNIRKDIDADQKLKNNVAVVYLSSSIEMNGWLWLSSATIFDPPGTALANAPADPPQKNQITQVDIIPDMDGDETLWRANV